MSIFGSKSNDTFRIITLLLNEIMSHDNLGCVKSENLSRRNHHQFPKEAKARANLKKTHIPAVELKGSILPGLASDIFGLEL